jgi:hypothetical protein
MFDEKFYRRKGNILEIFLIGRNEWHPSTHTVGYLNNIYKLEDPDALVSKNSAFTSQTPEQSAEAALPDLTHEQQKKEGAMHKIKDLSNLIDLLSAKPAKDLSVTLSTEIQEGLKGCLELGLKQISSFIPMQFPPRMTFALHDQRGQLPKLRVKPKDFARFCDATYAPIPGAVKVDKDLLAEGVGWLFDGMEGPRLESILKPLEAALKACTENTFEASRMHVQEIVDWLDNIMDNRANQLANDLRKSVKDLNENPLLAEISL